MGKAVDTNTDSTPDEVQAGEGEALDLDAVLDAAFDETDKQPEPEPDAAATDQGEEDGQAGQEETGPDAPDDWSAEDKEVFGKLPKDARELALKQYKNFQSGFTKKSQSLSENARFADQVKELLSPYRDQLAVGGMDEMAAIRQLVGYHQMYAKDPVGYVKQVAEAAGIDLGRLAEPEGEQDPQSAALQRRIDQLESQLQTFSNQQTVSQQTAINQQIEAFKGEVGEDGQPLRPHFDAVQGMMGAYLRDGQAKDMQEAYDMAVWATPSLRSKMIEAEKQAILKAEQEKQAVEKAKRASRTGGGNPPSGAVNTDDLDALLNNSLEQHGIL